MTARPPEHVAAVRRAMCEADPLYFARYFFKQREGIKFLVNWHHRLIADALEKVLRGEITDLVINIPPGGSKTELAVINFIARGLAINARARFLHVTYSDDLAMTNSAKAKEIVQSDEYQELWPLTIRDDSRAKKRWNVEVEVNGKKRTAGGVYAVSLGGQITGFRAGHMAPGFQGAIICDDPLKADDAYSKPQRDKANRALISTLKSRKANPKTPTIVIMQRLAEEDPTGFIEKGNVPGNWQFLKIPALITDEYVASLPEHLRPTDTELRDEQGRFSYWPYKEPLEDMLALEIASAHVFNGQYQQRPSALGGGLLKGSWFPRFSMVPALQWRGIFADTAQKTQEVHDYSVFACYGLTFNGRVLLLDQIRGKWEAPALKQQFLDFWNKHKEPTACGSMLRCAYIEDKASGTGLIQDVKRTGFIPIEAVQRDRDKLTRLMDVQSYISAGYVELPAEASFVSEFVNECESFTALMTHAHDDQIDPLIDAVDRMLGTKGGGGAFDYERLTQ